MVLGLLNVVNDTKTKPRKIYWHLCVHHDDASLAKIYTYSPNFLLTGIFLNHDCDRFPNVCSRDRKIYANV